jgi:hypothetical protein
MKVGLVLGAGGVLGGAWLTGGIHALARETDWDPGGAEHMLRDLPAGEPHKIRRPEGPASSWPRIEPATRARGERAA